MDGYRSREREGDKCQSVAVKIYNWINRACAGRAGQKVIEAWNGSIGFEMASFRWASAINRGVTI